MTVTVPSLPSPASEVPRDVHMIASLWPILLTSMVGLLPFTVFSTFLVPISEESHGDVAAVGSLRGLGGIAALVVGITLAPLLDRLPKAWLASVSLVLLSFSAIVGTISEFVALVLFCLLIGAATSVLNPALTAISADKFGTGVAAGRAATLVSASQSLAALLAAPLLALLAIVWGWRGNLIAIAVVALVLASFFFRGKEKYENSAPDKERLSYWNSFVQLKSLPRVLPLLLISALRTAVFMGYLAYLAAYYHDRFNLNAGWFSLVWTLSGAAFFLGNFFAGKLANATSTRFTVAQILTGALTIGLIAIIGFYLINSIVIALVFTTLLGMSHATVAACVTTLLVSYAGDRRGMALGMNAAGMSLGVFFGAAVGGLGLAVANYAGMAAVFGGLTAIALAVGFRFIRPQILLGR